MSVCKSLFPTHTSVKWVIYRGLLIQYEKLKVLIELHVVNILVSTVRCSFDITHRHTVKLSITIVFLNRQSTAVVVLAYRRQVNQWNVI